MAEPSVQGCINSVFWQNDSPARRALYSFIPSNGVQNTTAAQEWFSIRSARLNLPTK